MEKIRIDGFKLIGLQLAQRTTNANGQSAIDCGNLWQKFETENFKERITGKSGEEIDRHIITISKYMANEAKIGAMPRWKF